MGLKIRAPRWNPPSPRQVVQNVTKRMDDTGSYIQRDPGGAALNATAQASGLPLIAAQLAFVGGLESGGWQRGGESFNAPLADPNAAFMDPSWRADLYRGGATVAAAAGGAAAGGALGTGTIQASAGTAPMWLTGAGALAGGALAGGAAAGTAAGLAAYQRANRGQGDGSGDGSGDGINAPTLNEANDPDLSAQFQRMRKAARALGRAGTIKYRGAGDLGAGSNLGDALVLTGQGSAQA